MYVYKYMSCVLDEVLSYYNHPTIDWAGIHICI